MALSDVAGVTLNTPNYGTKVTNIDASFVELYSVDVNDQVFDMIYNQSGKQFGMLNMLGLAGRTANVKNQTMKVLEYGQEQQPLTVGATAIVVAAAGADATLILASTDYDSDGNAPLRLNDTVLLPPAYCEVDGSVPTYAPEYIVTAISTDAVPDTEYTLSPLNDGAEVAIEIPIGTKLAISANKHAAGTGQPSGKARGIFSYNYYPSIFKESMGIEGGTGAIDRYSDSRIEVGFRETWGLGEGMFDTGVASMYLNKEIIAAQWRLNAQINSAIWTGERNSNSVTNTSDFGGTNSVQSFEGYWNILQTYGSQKTYNNVWEMWDFDVTDQIFDYNGVGADVVFVPVSRNLFRLMENSGLEFIKEYSQGTELFEKSMEKVGARFKKFEKSGRIYFLIVLDNLTNPNTLGVDGLEMNYSGAMIPNEEFKMKVDGNDVSIDNVTLGNVNYNGENRTMVMDNVSGVNGYGQRFLNDTDGSFFYMLSHKLLVTGAMNKQIGLNKA